MVVQNNMTAKNANRHLGINNKKLSKSLEKLSSGYQINRAGDNAAGLAVSEKMRAQIAGMTQAVKNAQDGISMAQTFEGALTETHGILDRMKTLADQMSNGTYDDAVDRTAAQQEFQQLNDELDQIADTDFNGIIVLNGGRMADGQLAVNGRFDYSDVSARAASRLGINDINLLDSQVWDNRGAADQRWNILGGWTRTAGQPSTYGPDSIDITFQFDRSSGKWNVISGTSGIDLTQVLTKQTTNPNGGFEVQFGATGGQYANVVVDQSKLSNGDTITLTFNNPSRGISAPTNAGAAVINNTDFTVGSFDASVVDIKVNRQPDLTDANMTADWYKLFKLLDGAEYTESFKSGVATTAGDFTLTLNDGTAIIGNTNQANAQIIVGKSTFSFVTTNAGVMTIKDETTGKNMLTITAQKVAAATDTSAGSVSWRLGFEHYEYDDIAKPTIEVAKTGNVSRSDAFKKSGAVMSYTNNVTLQVGSRTKDGVNFTFEYASTSIGSLKDDMDCTSRGLGTDKLTIADQESANDAIDKIDHAINKVSLVRGTFGALQNRLEHKIENLNVSVENLTSAESQIRDADMPKEMMEFTKNQILAQAAQSMLAQANQLPQSVLSLLQ